MSFLDKFLSKVSITNHCWEWIGYCKNGRYGTIYFGKKSFQAHVMSHILYVGPVEPGNVVMHSCDNPTCVNPAHLSQGSLKDNTQDCIAKGRFRKPSRYKLSEESVTEIKKLLSQKIPQRAIARKFGVTQAMICVLNRR
jgi:hypothetical protein